MRSNPGPLAPIAAAAFAKFGSVDFGPTAPKKLRVRLCTPSVASKIVAATAVAFRADSPDGQLISRVALGASLSHANCGYLIGSYWAPGVMNDDPTAMQEAQGTAAALMGRHDVFLSIEGGGHVAIDWFRFEH